MADEAPVEKPKPKPKPKPKARSKAAAKEYVFPLLPNISIDHPLGCRPPAKPSTAVTGKSSHRGGKKQYVHLLCRRLLALNASPSIITDTDDDEASGYVAPTSIRGPTPFVQRLDTLSPLPRCMAKLDISSLAPMLRVYYPPCSWTICRCLLGTFYGM